MSNKSKNEPLFCSGEDAINSLSSNILSLLLSKRTWSINPFPFFSIEKDKGPVFTLIPPCGLILFDDTIFSSDVIGITSGPYST